MLGLEDYQEILQDAAAQGCKAVQFIGGEPTLNPLLPKLLELASVLQYEVIEVYTNLVALPQALLECLKRHDVCVATSVYSYDQSVHDEITTRVGSWKRTTRNMQRVLSAGLSLRASVVVMDSNREHIEETTSWLRSLGVSQVGIDNARQFGRAQRADQCAMGDLCGECSKGTLCVGPDGEVAPCIMSKAWAVGSLSREKFRDILSSERLTQTRQSIYAQTLAVREHSMGGCNPDRPNKCGPDYGGPCNPCNPNQACGPNSCRPVRS